ncbi:hypothetical protein Pint_23368 [Pistacia integerrima]|uniref:Uncharacterized protein n=1 Tax=Pistacia integerrima TaxID=434235 RepID=A0ACC0YIA1_9ROSI|nr:hypothetical protein Pint_23368 [Pistacia integerrima]
MEGRSTSLIIYGFALITVLYFVPSCLAARQLLDFPPPYNPVGEDHEHDDQSKSGVHGSVSDHAGSATGDTPPGGVNGPPSPTSYQTNSNRVTNGRNCQVVQTVDAYGNTRTVTTGTGCNNNGNYVGGQQNGGAYYYAPPPPEYGGYPYYYRPGSGNENSGYP